MCTLKKCEDKLPIHTAPKPHPHFHHTYSPQPMYWTRLTLPSAFLMGAHLAKSLVSVLPSGGPFWGHPPDLASPEAPEGSDVQPGAQRTRLCSARPRVSGWLHVTHPPNSGPKGRFQIPVGPDARAHLLFPSPTPLPEEMPARSLGRTQQGQAPSTGTAPLSLHPQA